jgi:addiction module RelE/StbE family toxin
MPFRIATTPRFDKNLQKLNQNEKALLAKKLNLLVEDPWHPSLRSKRIRGTDGLFECSVNMDVRIIWRYEGNTIILLLDIGHHDVLKQF